MELPMNESRRIKIANLARKYGLKKWGIGLDSNEYILVVYDDIEKELLNYLKTKVKLKYKVTSNLSKFLDFPHVKVEKEMKNCIKWRQ